MLYIGVRPLLLDAPRLKCIMNAQALLDVSAPSDEHLYDAGAAWHRVCAVAELEPLWAEAALVGQTQIALVKLTDGRVFAVDHYDPVGHANVMARGIVGSAKGRPTLASPLYKQVYDLATGECLSEDGPQLRAYPVRIEHGMIEVHAGQPCA